METGAGPLGFVVSVDGGFIDSRRWLVHAVLCYGSSVPEGRHVDLARCAQVELALGIVRQAERGRRLGARRVHVLVEGDADTAAIFGGAGAGEARRGEPPRASL
jgi:hypothetical protein